MIKSAKHFFYLLRRHQIFHKMLFVNNVSGPFHKILRTDTKTMLCQKCDLAQAISLPAFQQRTAEGRH